MNLSEISGSRLINQHIGGLTFSRPGEIVGWMGAMQAQDYSMAKWAVGIRLPGSTDAIVEAAINNGDIIRTHVLRPTWHLVSANDVSWILELSAPHILASMVSRHRQLEITDGLIKKSNDLIVTALSKGNHLTRKELVSLMKNSGIATGDNRPSHLLMIAELTGLICSGRKIGKNQTYALFCERVPHKKRLTRDVMLAMLAIRYFSSHGPATLQDFIWWSGLPARDAKTALEMVKNDLDSATTDIGVFWFGPAGLTPVHSTESLLLLPAFDELIISYRDRSAVLGSENHSSAISSNGMFWPVLIMNGKVKGIWKRTLKKDTVIIEISTFQPFTNMLQEMIEEKTLAYGSFIGRKAVLLSNHADPVRQSKK